MNIHHDVSSSVLSVSYATCAKCSN